MLTLVVGGSRSHHELVLFRFLACRCAGTGGAGETGDLGLESGRHRPHNVSAWRGEQKRKWGKSERDGAFVNYHI